MKVYTINEISQYGINYDALKDSLKLKFFNRVFVRTGDFPKRFREEAIKTCLDQKKASLKSFIVETAFLMTVWTEEKIHEENSPQSTDTAQDNRDDLKVSSQSVKMYRGVAYQSEPQQQPITEDELEKLATEQPELLGYWQKKLNFPEHPVKTYRGIPY